MKEVFGNVTYLFIITLVPFKEFKVTENLIEMEV